MIKVEALTRKYGDFVAVDKVSFEIGPHEIVGLLGHNGAGKTTVMKMLTGYLEASSGKISVNGMDASVERQRIQAEIGYLPESSPLYPEMTVIDYLDYAASLRGVPENERNEKVISAIQKTKLVEVALNQISTLSRGYKQRLGVAQAIINSPKIIILDEPTNGLDPTQILQMRALIRELSETATVVLSTHILQEVHAICSRVIIISNGQLALDSDIANLQNSGQLLISVDQPAEKCSAIFEKVGKLKMVSCQQKDQKYNYTLESAAQDPSDLVPDLARTLVEAGFKIYLIQPVVRDLESIFREISSKSKPRGAANNGSSEIKKGDEKRAALGIINSFKSKDKSSKSGGPDTPKDGENDQLASQIEKGGAGNE